MKTLAITISTLAMLSLAACGGDTGGGAPAGTSGTSDAANAASMATPSASSPSPANRVQPGAAVTDPAAAATAARPSTARSYTGFDMAGIYLGMSPEEVEAAMRAYAADITIKKDLISFDYNALGARYKTDSFVHYIGGSTYGGKLSLDVRFSYPPGPLEVVGMSRGDRHQDSPIAQSVYVESLIEKYGPPATDTGSVDTGGRVERTLEWPIGNGTVQCLSKGTETTTNPVLDRMSQDGRRYPNPTPEFAQQCISMLRYVLRGEPVVRASGSMLDVVASANAEFEARAWIQSLVDEKSSPGTERPTL